MSTRKKRRLMLHSWLLLATGIVIIIGVAMMTYSTNKSLKPLDGTIFAKEGDGVYIEQLQLSSGDFWNKSDAIPVVVYRGRIYVRNEWNPLTYEVAKKLQGEQVGTTKDNLKGWDSDPVSLSNLPSNTSVSSIYKVKGYDSRFRLMTIQEDSQIGWMYECLNNVYIKNGACLFDELKLSENIESVTYQTLKEWNSSSKVFHEVELDQEFWNLIDQLYRGELVNYGRDTKPNLYELDRKVYYLTMKDGSVNQLIVFADRYIAYQGLAAYFVFDLTMKN